MALVIAIVTCLIGQAAPPLMNTGRPDRLISLSAHLGEGIYTVRQNYSKAYENVTSFKLSPGNRFAVGAEAVLHVRNFFGVGTSFDFAVNNYNFSMTRLYGANAESVANISTMYSDNRVYTIDIPVFLRFTFDLATSRNVKWINEIGAFLTRGIGGKTKITTYGALATQFGEIHMNHGKFDNPYYDNEDGIVNTIERNDAGMHIATGITVDKIEVKCTFHAGLKNIALNYGLLNTKLYTMSFELNAGYIF